VPNEPGLNFSARSDNASFKILANGPMVKAEIDEAAEANGISERTLFRAKDELGVMAKKDGPNGAWTWRLAEEAAKKVASERVWQSWQP